MFHDISFDDLVIKEYLEKQTMADFAEFECRYNIYIVNEYVVNTFVSRVHDAEDPSKDDVWNCFEEANKNAIKTIQKYRD